MTVEPSADARRAARRAPPAQVAAWLVLTATVAFLSLRGWGAFQLGAYQDDAIYAVQARSIAAGEPYVLISRPGPPQEPKYPFAFPLLLAPVAAAFPGRDDLLPVVSLAATLASVAILFWCWPLLSPGTSRAWGLATAALHGLAPAVVDHTRMVMSEAVFTMLSLVALALTEACAARARPGWARPLTLGGVLMLAVFTRSIGIALCGAALLRLVLAAPARAPQVVAATLAGGLGSLGLVLALSAVDLGHLVPAQHVAELRDAREVQPASGDSARASRLRRAIGVARVYALTGIRQTVLPVGGGVGEDAVAAAIRIEALPALVGAAVLLLVGLGFARSISAAALAPSVLIFEVSYLALLAMWPWPISRYLLPLQPWLALQLVLGAGVVAGLALRSIRARRATSFAAAAVLAALSLGRSAAIRDSRDFTRDLRAGADWLAAHSAPDAVVMAEHPEAVFLHAGRRGVPIPADSTRDDAVRSLRAAGADYLLVAPRMGWSLEGRLTYAESTRDVLLPAVDAMVAGGEAALVFEEPAEMVRIYRLRRADAPAPGAGGRQDFQRSQRVASSRCSASS